MLLDLNWRVMGESLPLFQTGFISTLSISLGAFVGALTLGVLACVMSLQSSRWLRAPAVVYIDAIRATPLLAQLYFLYFGLPLLGVTMPEIAVGVLALSLNSGAYVSEIIRSGIMGIPVGQMEASASAGMSYSQQMRLVILDACRDNPFSRSMKRIMASRAIGRGLARIESTSPNSRQPRGQPQPLSGYDEGPLIRISPDQGAFSCCGDRI